MTLKWSFYLALIAVLASGFFFGMRTPVLSLDVLTSVMRWVGVGVLLSGLLAVVRQLRGEATVFWPLALAVMLWLSGFGIGMFLQRPEQTTSGLIEPSAGSAFSVAERRVDFETR